MAITENILTNMKINDEASRGVKRSLASVQTSMQNINGQFKAGTLNPVVLSPISRYFVVSDVDIDGEMQVNMKAGEPQEISGALAQRLIERGRGMIRLFDPEAEQKAKEEADMKTELAELKEAVKEMKKSKTESVPKVDSKKKDE